MAFDVSSSIRIHQGKIISADDYAARLADAAEVKAAQSDAVRIREEAEAEARRIIDAAQGRADEMDAEMRRIADQELGRFVETHAIDEAAKAVQEVLETAHRLRADFDQMTPWFGGFVQAAMEKITGELPRKKLWSGVVREGLKEQRERWDLKLRCHPALVDLMNEVLAEDDKLSEAITLVEGDRDIPRGTCHLVSKKGVLDISVKTQVKTLCRAIENMME